jgi:AsmA protein
MKTLLKILAALVGIVVLLIVVAAVVIPLFFDPNDYKDEIAKAVQQETGRELRIEGDIGLSVFPWLGVDLGTVALGNPPGFSEPVFARSEQVKVRVKLLPLLQREIQMDTVTVKGLRVNLERNAAGNTNWEDLVQATTQPPDKPAEAPGEEQRAPAISALAVGGLDVRDANLSYLDAATGDRYVIRELDLETQELALDTPVGLALTFAFEGTEPEVSGQVEGTAELTVDLDRRQYTVSDLELDTNLAGATIPGGKLQVALAANSVYDEAKGRVRVTDLQIEASKFNINGAQGEVVLRAEATGDLEKGTYQMPGLQVQADLTGEAIPGEALKANVDAQLGLDLARQTMSVSDMQLTAADLQVTGRLDATEILKTPKLEGSLSVNPFNPRALMARLEQPVPETADPEVLTAASLKTTIGGTPQSLTLKPLTLKLDDTALEGQVTILPASAPAFRFDLAVNGINVDRYLPPKEAGKETQAQQTERSPATPGTAASAASAPGALPLDALRGLDLEGQLRVGQLVVTNLTASNIELPITAKDGLIQVSPAQAQLYEGTYTGNIGLDVRASQPTISLDERLAGIQAGPLLKDLQGQDRLRGHANASLKATAQGTSADQITKTLNGNSTFAFTDGAVKGINIGRMIRKAKAALEGRSLPPEEGPPETDFSELKGSIQFQDGVARNQDLSAKSPLLRVTGQGSANLVTENVDYRLRATLVGTATGQGGKELAELKGIPIPIHITGSFSEPDFDLDLEGLVKARAEQELERKRQKLEQKVQDKLQEELGEPGKELFKGLFNR